MEDVLDELLEGEDQLYHQLLCFDFDDEDDEDEDYTDSPRREERRNSSLTQEMGECGDISKVRVIGGDGNLDNEDEEDDDEEDDMFNEEDDDQSVEASSVADDDEDEDPAMGAEDNRRRYRLNRQLKQEAADLINDWQKTLLEEQEGISLQSTTTPASSFTHPSTELFQTPVFRARFQRQLAQYAQLLLQQFIWCVKEDGFISHRAASVCCLLGDLLKRRIHHDNDRKLISSQLMPSVSTLPGMSASGDDPKSSLVEALVAEMNEALKGPDSDVKMDIVRKISARLQAAAAAPSSPTRRSSEGGDGPISPLRRTTRSLLAQLPEGKGDSVLHSAFLPKMTTLLAEAQYASGQPNTLTLNTQTNALGSPSFPLTASSLTGLHPRPLVAPLTHGGVARIACDFTTCAVHVGHRMSCIYSTPDSVDLDVSILPPTTLDQSQGFLPIEDKLLTRAIIKFGIGKWHETSMKFLPCKRAGEIQQRFDMLTNDKADPNPLKRYRQEKTHMIQCDKNWKDYEDKALLEGVKKRGRKWSTLCHMPNLRRRTANDLLKRYEKLQRWKSHGYDMTYDEDVNEVVTEEDTLSKNSMYAHAFRKKQKQQLQQRQRDNALDMQRRNHPSSSSSLGTLAHSDHAQGTQGTQSTQAPIGPLAHSVPAGSDQGAIESDVEREEFSECEELSDVEREEFSADDEWSNPSPLTKANPSHAHSFLPPPPQTRKSAYHSIKSLSSYHHPLTGNQPPSSSSSSSSSSLASGLTSDSKRNAAFAFNPPAAPPRKHSNPNRRECLFGDNAIPAATSTITGTQKYHSPGRKKKTMKRDDNTEEVFSLDEHTMTGSLVTSPGALQRVAMPFSPEATAGVSTKCLTPTHAMGLGENTQLESWQNSPVNSDHLLFLACVVEKSQHSPLKFPRPSSAASSPSTRYVPPAASPIAAITKVRKSPRKKRMFSGVEKIKHTKRKK